MTANIHLFHSDSCGDGTSNLGASNSVEQSNSSSSNSATNQSTDMHTYVNTEINLSANNSRTFSPLYMNHDDESVKEMLSERDSRCGSKTREARGWSLTSTRSHMERIHSLTHPNKQCRPHQLEKNHQHLPHTRARSVTANSRFKVEEEHVSSLPRPKTFSNNLSSVLMKPLPLPPCTVPATQRVWSQPQLTNLHLPPPTHTPPPPMESSDSDVLGVSDQCFFLDSSGDYTAPVPISERYKYDPKNREMNDLVEIASIQTPPYFDDCHDYSDPDDPDHDSQTSAMQNNHLGEDIHPEASPSDQLAGFDRSTDEVLPEAFGYSYGYVPTEVCVPMCIYIMSLWCKHTHMYIIL